MKLTGYKSDLNIDEKVMMAIVRVAELFKKDADAIFREFGLTFPQYNALRVLEASGNGRNTITNVCRVMLVSGANMTGIVKRLEKNGFLVREKDPADDRITILKITAKGKTAIKNIAGQKDRYIQNQLKGFSKKQKEEIASILVKMMKNRSCDNT